MKSPGILGGISGDTEQRHGLGKREAYKRQMTDIVTKSEREYPVARPERITLACVSEVVGSK